MKKSLITMGIVILSSIILPITAVAAEYTSNGAIIFETDNDLTKPVDPTDPENQSTRSIPRIQWDQIQELLGRCQLILPPVSNLAIKRSHQKQWITMQNCKSSLQV